MLAPAMKVTAKQKAGSDSSGRNVPAFRTGSTPSRRADAYGVLEAGAMQARDSLEVVGNLFLIC